MTGARPAVTKFALPTVPNTVVRRPGLLSRLDATAQHPCTLVAGSPGSGKSVLLSSWVAEHPETRCAWVSCDRWDYDELRLWTSIASAFAVLEPGSTADTLDVLIEDPDSIDDVVASLVNELATRPGAMWLILDDLHVVPSSALGGLATFVERLPPDLHVVIASRIDPVLPLQRWRARGQLAEIRDADLRLDEGDVGLLMTNFGLDLSDGDISTLTGRTEGWLAALQLAALSLRRGEDPPSFIRRFAGSEQVVADFLVEEVLDRQSDRMVEFLKATSVVDEFDAELASFLLGDGGGDGAHLLREAMRAGLFISPLGGDLTRYRYHQLFRELLHAQLAEDPRLTQVLHARAGEWYEKTGQYLLAVDQFVRARDLGRAFDILHEHVAHDWFAINPTDSEAWLDHLSDEDVRAHRDRMVDYAIALGLAGKVEEQGRWLALASSQGSADDEGESSFDIRMAAATAHWHGMRGDPEPAIAFERDVVPRVKPGTDYVIDQFPIVSARAHLYNGQPTAAITTCDRGLTMADPVSRAVLLGIRGRALFELGRLHLARQAAEEATEVARQCGIEHHVGHFDALLTLGGLNLEADRLDEAERLIEDATSRSERIRPPFAMMALVERAGLFRARGELIEGLAILEQGRAVLPAGVVSPLYHRADALEAIIRIDIGEPEHALALARTLPHTPRRRLIEATALLSLGETERADETTATIDLPNQDVRLTLELSVIRAEVQRQRGPPHHAGLQHIIDIARVQDFLRTVLDGPFGLLSDLVALLVRSPRDQYTDSLLAAAHRVQARRAAGPTPGGAALSGREQEVLRCLQTRLTTREITGELYISMNTLKSHLKSINRKLGASSRSDAVARARTLGLL